MTRPPLVAVWVRRPADGFRWPPAVRAVTRSEAERFAYDRFNWAWWVGGGERGHPAGRRAAGPGRGRTMTDLEALLRVWHATVDRSHWRRVFSDWFEEHPECQRTPADRTELPIGFNAFWHRTRRNSRNADISPDSVRGLPIGSLPPPPAG